MRKKKLINYYPNLIHYLNEFKEISLDSEKVLKNILEYVQVKFSKESVTDTTCILNIERLIEKFSYCSKYLDVTLDFYELEDKS